MATIRSRSSNENDEPPPRHDVVGHIGPPSEMPPVTIRRSTLRKAWGRALAADVDDDAYDALTDLFLGEVAKPADRASPSAPVAPVPPQAPNDSAPKASPLLQQPEPEADPTRPELSSAARGIELLILGHLPVLSNAWASQYARTVAEAEESPVAFVQARAGQVSVEIVGDAAGSSAEPAPDLRTALRRAAGIAGHWILRSDETEEPTLAHRPSIRWLTLLTSADEVAVVGAYRAIKHLVPSDMEPAPETGSPVSQTPEPESGQSWGEWPGPAVRVAIMGSADDAADEAYAKISAAVRTFLSRPLRRSPGAQRISSPRPSRPLFSGRSPGGAGAVIALLEEAMRSPSKPVQQPTVRPAALAAVPASQQPVPQTATPAPVVSSPAADSLARHIAGLSPLDLRCPYAQSAEFALAADGRLHILARRATPAAGAIGVEPLLVASAWATAHAPLIRMALKAPAAQPEASQAPLSHLFVDEPRDTRGLLDTDVRLHLLASVAVAGQTAWICRDLN